MKLSLRIWEFISYGRDIIITFVNVVCCNWSFHFLRQIMNFGCPRIKTFDAMLANIAQVACMETHKPSVLYGSLEWRVSEALISYLGFLAQQYSALRGLQIETVSMSYQISDEADLAFTTWTIWCWCIKKNHGLTMLEHEVYSTITLLIPMATNQNFLEKMRLSSSGEVTLRDLMSILLI